MPPKNNLGNKRKKKPKAPKARHTNINPRRPPLAVRNLLGTKQLQGISGIAFGSASSVQWSVQNEATKRYALLNAVGKTSQDVDAMINHLTSTRAADQQSGRPATTLELSINPNSNVPLAMVDRAIAKINLYNQIAPAGERIEIVSESGDVLALKGGWANRNEIDALRAKLGKQSVSDKLHDAITTEHPSRVRSMIENLSNPNLVNLGQNDAIVLGDSARAWGRVDRTIEGLLTPASNDPTELDPPRNAFNQQRDAAWLRDQVRNQLRNLNPATGDNLKVLLEQVANYKRGLMAPLLNRLGSAYQDNETVVSVYKNTPLEANLPSDSVLDQAARSIGQLGGKTPTVSVQTLAEQGSDLIGQAIKVPDRSTQEYRNIVRVLERRAARAGAELDATRLTELADIFSEAKRTNQSPRLITTDWDVMRTLRGFHARQEPLGKNEKQRADAVTVAGIQLDLRSVASVKNEVAPQTEVGALGQAKQDTLTFGTPVVITQFDTSNNQKKKLSERNGYIYGYTPEGRARVLLQDDNGPPTTLYTLSDQNNVKEEISLGKFPALNESEIGGNLVTEKWQSRTEDLQQLANGPRPQDPVKAMLYDNIQRMRDLRTRKVAGSNLTADQFTDEIANGGFTSYIVGGATRDILLGKNPQDIDFASTMPAIDSYNAIVNKGLAQKNPNPNDPNDLAIRKNVPFGAVQVEADDPTGLDIISTHDGHNSALRLDLDAFARDFTVNAVYYDIAGDKVVDPTGKGLSDLASKTARFVQGSADTVLKDDPVLVARWMRMMQKGFQPESQADTVAALKWLQHHANNMEEPLKKRFVDRLKTSKNDADTLVTQIFGNLQSPLFPNPTKTAKDAIALIFG